MSELSNLVGVLGAIDDRVVENPGLIPEVGRLLCPYNNGAAGWYPEFQRWMEELPSLDGEEVEQVELPTLDDALARLAEGEGDIAQASDPGLRLLALAVLGRIDDRYGPRGESADLTIGALRGPGLAADADQAGALLELLTDVDAFPGADKWDDMMSAAVERGLITEAAAQPLRCRGSVVEVGVTGHPHPATAMTTTLVAEDLEFADAVAFLDPGQWPHCGPAWCFMTHAGTTSDGLERYEEIIGLHCPTPFLTTCLGFRKVEVPHMSVLAYKLIPGDANCHCDGRVLLDEGSIAVRNRAPLPGVTVTTTKRVLFKGVDPGPLSMFSCILGYADMGQLLVYTCAERHAGRPGKRTGKKKLPVGTTIKPEIPPAVDEPGECAEIIDEVAKLAKRCVTDTANRSRTNLDKAVSGKYSTDDAANDLAAMAKRSMRDVGVAVKLGRKGLRIARDTVVDDDTEEPE